jgi:hypothetical protein
MKKVQLIEWGIIAVGLIFGYKFFEGIITVFFQLINQVLRSDELGEGLLGYFLVVLIYVVAFIAIIRNSHKLALYLNGPAVDESLQIRINKQSLLQVILIGICMVTLLTSIAEILLYIVEVFRKDVSRGDLGNDSYDMPNKYLFKQEAVKAIISTVVIFFSKDISGWFIRKNEPQELVLESDPEKPTDVQQ